MIFVTLDNKEWCKGIYVNGKLVFDHFPDNLSKTWKYASYLHDLNIEYASLYVGGASISDVCPEYLQPKWKILSHKLNSYYKSFLTSKVSLEDNCFFDLVPQQFLLELCDQKIKIIEHVLSTTKKPKNYDHLLSAQKVLTDISLKQLHLDFSEISNNIEHVKNKSVIQKLKACKTNVEYNLFGSKTGRLTNITGTFPILTLNKNFRDIIKPQNDILVELDYNAAELRTLISLLGEGQPTGDIHDWNAKRLGIDRQLAKKEVFAWLYGSKQIDSRKYSEIFGVDRLFKDQYNDLILENVFGRKIKTDNFHKLNYLVQSTTSDLVLEQIVKISKLLENKKSYISFLLHDSVVIDLKKEDISLVKKLSEVFSNTRLGFFPVRISAGKKYGSLQELN